MSRRRSASRAGSPTYGSSSSADAINEAITRHRLDAVKKLLATTNRPIKVISESCGYTDLAYLKTLFKRRFGCTMRDWRRQNHL